MPNAFFSKKSKSSQAQGSMAEAHGADDGTVDMPTNSAPIPTTMASAAMTVTSSSAVEAEALFREVYQCAKLNSEWYNVTKAVKEHPEWLLRIPEGRKWTMFHQIVFSGNVTHVKEILAHQIMNPNFSLLFQSGDGKTVKDVAQERSHIFPTMSQYINLLAATDKMLDFAQNENWDEVIKAVSSRPDIANEKPPYRKKYLIHILATAGVVDIFKKVHEKSPLDITLKAHDNKTALEIATENHHERLVQFINNLPAPPAGTSSASAESHIEALRRRYPNYSPGFYDDISISIFPPNMDFPQPAPIGSGGHSGFASSHHYLPVHHTASVPTASSSHGASASASKPKSPKPKTTPEDDAEYEKKMMNNLGKVSSSDLTNLITCPITKQIMREPVLASDGHTYEESAIIEWLKTSNKSPMTNEPLKSLELQPNYVIKSLLKSLEGSSKEVSSKQKK